MLRILLALTITLFPTLSLAEEYSSLSLNEEELYAEAEARLIWVGYDHDESLEGIPVPSFDHRLKVVAIYPIELGDTGETFIDCFVKVAEVPWLQHETIPVDEHGWPYVEDLDGVLRPIQAVQVDTTHCTSPSGAVGEP